MIAIVRAQWIGLVAIGAELASGSEAIEVEIDALRRTVVATPTRGPYEQPSKEHTAHKPHDSSPVAIERPTFYHHPG
jgi:hypothetical protein